jgi:phosphoesterase RecJ-like protein
VDVEACATSEIVYRLISPWISKWMAMATAIYTGILTDTGSFRFSNTNRAAFSICEAMVAMGVNPSAVAQHVYGTYSLGRIKLLNLALDSIEISNNGQPFHHDGYARDAVGYRHPG